MSLNLISKFGRNLVWIRGQKSLTQVDLAGKLSITKASVSQWETGATMPSIFKLIRLRELTGYTIDELLFIDLENKANENL